MLSDQDIRKELGRALSIEPFVSENVQPASVDLRLDRGFEVLSNQYIPELDPSTDNTRYFSPRYCEDVDSSFLLEPGFFALGSTYEHVSLSGQVAAKVEGKSSLGRLGLLVHATAGFIDPGFEGQITLELANLTGTAIRLYPGMLVAQICFFRLETPAESIYGSAGKGSHYSRQRGPTLSRGWQNFTISELE